MASTPTLLQVGAGPTKNLARVIEALKGIRCRLWVVGNLGERQTRLLELSGVEYRNFPQISDEELVALYIESDILIFASTYEGFGLPIIEAQAVGRPVIASDAASLPEIAGEGAEFVKPEDHRSIRDAVERLLSDAALRERLVVLGRENVRRFESLRIAQEYASVYREVAAM
jgi:glycosyltransferase involved in cell wall biosynthesis